MRSKSAYIPVIFLLVGFLWAITSEWGINFLYEYYLTTPPVYIRMFSRLGFVILTGILLFFLIRRQQVKLEKSELQYRNIFFSNPGPMWIYELGSLKIVAANNAAIHKYGYSHSEFLNMSIPDIRAASDNLFLEAIKAGDTQKLEKFLWEHKTKSGEQISVSISTHKLTFNGRKCNMVMVTDVSQIVESRRKLQEAYEVEKSLNKELDENLHLIEKAHHESRKMAEVIDNVSNLVIIFGEDRIVTWANKAFLEFTGYTLQECIGKTPGDLLGGHQTNPATLAILKEGLDQKQFVSVDIVNYKKNGEQYWAETNISSIFDSKGNFEFFISIETVINDRVEKQEMLDKQYRTFREIAWSNSHEIRRPLATILGLIELLKHAGTDLERTEYISLLEQSSNELDQIVRNNATKINNLESEVKPIPVG